ncbi:MAG: sodium:solute symporter, partial [Planctomycetota bacterium]
YRRFRPDLDEKKYLRVGRVAVCVWGLILGAFACFCVIWQQTSGEGLINFALSVMTFAYSGLCAVFLTLLLTKRGSGASVIASLITGFTVILAYKLVGLIEEPTGLLRFLKSHAFPWQLCTATVSAFAVCLLGKQEARQDA